jgi:hypothetical protein
MTEHGEEHLDEPDDRIKQVENKIAKAREHAEEAIGGSFADEPTDRFVDSGADTAKQEDDQTIAPG